MTPTAEQQKCLDAYLRGDSMVVEAGAGTGKTSTLRLLGQAKPNTRGIYLAYNKSIATEAQQKFAGTKIVASTAHSLAFRAVGRRYIKRLNGSRMPAWKAAKHLGITESVQIPGGRFLGPDSLARIVMEMVDKFCKTAHEQVERFHFPLVEGLDETPGIGPNHRALAERLLPFARKAWDDIVKVDGVLRFQHDHYLKMWQLSAPTLDAEVIFFDEAQDADPVIASIVDAQTHAQRVFVGDRAQAIYGWRGAIDAMGRFQADSRLCLSQSFRFGPAIATEANRWLEQLDTPLRLTGTDRIPSVIGEFPDADAVLCRTNAGALQETLDGQARGLKVHLVGGSSQTVAFVKAAADLQDRGRTSHPDLFLFTSWGQVQDYADTADGSDLKALVSLVDKYTCPVILEALEQAVPENRADLIVSTAHKAKGREWDSVRIGGDFAAKTDKETGEEKELDDAEVMLRYVAVTRAMISLDLGPLAEKKAAAAVA